MSIIKKTKEFNEEEKIIKNINDDNIYEFKKNNFLCFFFILKIILT